MSENERLRALLAEARMYLTMNGGSADDRIVRSIDAALAEPVVDWRKAHGDAIAELSKATDERDEARSLLQDVAFACRGLKPLSDAASTVVGPVFRQRDEARAEVERLREAINAWAKTSEWNYRRGAEAMREAAAACVGSDTALLQTYRSVLEGRIRDLPVPEDKP